MAYRAGVSKTTVSHVINSTRLVEEETRRRVLEAIQELGYRPNAAARSLTTKRTGIIGVVISDASNPFFAEVLLGVEAALRPQNYALIICNTDEILENEAHALNLLLSQRVDGIIAAATSQQWVELSQAEASHTPIVFVDREFENLQGPFVGVNNRHAAYLGVRHLVQCGYHSIGILAGFERLSTMRERLEGYYSALQEAGIPLREDWIIRSQLSIEEGRQAIRQLLNRPERPAAVFVNNNLLALGALVGIREIGLSCPKDVALVSFDDHPWAAVSDPPLTVIRQPADVVGRSAADLLLSMIRQEPAPKLRIILDCELVVRESSGCVHLAGRTASL